MIIQLRGRVAEGRWDDLVSFLRKAIPFYEEPGGIRVRLLRDVTDPDVLVEIIEYETEESYAADQLRVERDPAMIARLEEWRGLLAGPVEVQTLRDVTPSDLAEYHRTSEGGAAQRCHNSPCRGRYHPRAPFGSCGRGTHECRLGSGTLVLSPQGP